MIFWILGFLGLSAAMGEGAVGDWGGVLTRESFNATPFISTVPYIAYCATMVIGRLSCDRLANRFGSSTVIRAGGFISGFGMLIGLLVGQVAGVIFGWFCVGLGLSIVMPLVFSAAGQLAHDKYSGQIAPSVAVARVSGTAYFGFMVGPPLIGFLSELVTLRWAMLLVVFLSCIQLFGGKYAKTE
jgi:MFS family permease